MSTNIVVVLADDLGYSDIGCYGGEIDTPVLDRLATRGVRAASFYNTARCSPSRASLLTGRHPHETGIGVLNDDLRPDGYPGTLSSEFPTIAELLKERGYATSLSGKWHLSADTSAPNDSWPTRRGFDDFYGTLAGASSYYAPPLQRGEEPIVVGRDEDYYFTDALSENAADFIRVRTPGAPFFIYLAYTAPHWPLHARAEDVAKYADRFTAGWDELRRDRLRRQIESGIVPPDTQLSPRDSAEDAWEDVEHKDWQAHRMAVYAAQVEAMDSGIGRVVAALEETGQLDDTLILFLSDNGGCAEEIPPPGSWKFRLRNPSHTRDGRPIALGNEPGIWPGPEDTYSSYGQAWANLSNTPFRLYKRWVHEGGISTPLIAHWPNGGLTEGGILPSPHQLTDLLPTLIEAAGGQPLPEGYPGSSMLAELRGGSAVDDHPLFWEHIGNCAARQGRWKIVRLAGGEWELYDIERDRAEEHDLAGRHPEVVTELAERWQDWADRVGVIAWPRLEQTLAAAAAAPAAP